jgi:lipid-A-disaccharide synthase
MAEPKILISAGEASGDLYASALTEALRRRIPDAEFFGCTGHRMREAGVRTIVDASDLAVVGLVEVVAHIPRIYKEFRKLVDAAGKERPAIAILTDSPDFHLRLARKLNRLGVPVVYLVAPQVWAWRKGRIRAMRRSLARVLCIFPFEEAFFRANGVKADYIGHPLTRIVRPTLSKYAFLRKHGIDGSRQLVTVLPGSRVGEISRHLKPLRDAAQRLHEWTGATMVLAAPANFSAKAGHSFFKERLGSAPIQVIEGETWDAIAHSDLALAASGTVTVETAILGTPMVTFYRVTGLSWLMGRLLVKVPFYSMVNLIAERKIVPELMQNQFTGPELAREALRFLQSPSAADEMRSHLADVRAKLSTREDPIERAADIVIEHLQTELDKKESVHGS